MTTPIGETVKHWRQLRKMTLSDLARAAKVSKGHLSTLENSETDPSATLLYRLALALDVRMELLVKGAVDTCEAPIVVTGHTFACELGKGHRDWHAYFGSENGAPFNLYWPD